MRTILVVALALLAAPAPAQDRPPQGIGFAQAEEGTWLCRHEQPEEALSCARELCIEQASGQECWPTAWCFPANWSGLMTVWIGEFHTTNVLCGAPSEAALTQAFTAFCAGHPDATSCDLTLVIDPDGNERSIEGVTWAGAAAPPADGAPEESAAEPQAPGAGAPAGGAADNDTQAEPGGG